MNQNQKLSKNNKIRRPTYSSLPTRRSHMKDVIDKTVRSVKEVERPSFESLKDDFENIEFNWKRALRTLTVLGVLGGFGAYYLKSRGQKSKGRDIKKH